MASRTLIRAGAATRADALAPGGQEGATSCPLGGTGLWLAQYRGPRGDWRFAKTARGMPIVCETAELALSVARYRVGRLKPFEEHHAN